MRQQNGSIILRSNRWYVTYWERRSENGVIGRKRVTHHLGPKTIRGKYAPSDIKDAAKDFMATVNGGKIQPERITTIGDFVNNVYLPWIKDYKRPSTVRGYRDIWEDHLSPLCANDWLKDVRTFHVQGWLDSITQKGLSRNSLKRIKSCITGIFARAKQQGYFDGANPADDTAVSPRAAEPQETFATTKGTRMNMNNLLNRVLLPALNAGGIEWHGWHGARRGLGSNLYRLGVPDVVIQRILRHSNVSTTTAYYIKTASPDVRIAMDKLESNFAESETIGRLEPISPRAK